jgi:hypothetical protein
MGCGKEFKPICVVSILVTFALSPSIPGIGRDTKAGGIDSKPVSLCRERLLSFMGTAASVHGKQANPCPL